jgi:hypothetical protein
MRDRRGWAALAGFAAVLVVLAPVQGSLASWSDRGALAGAAIRTGILDVQVDGQDAVSLPGLSGVDLLPGAVLTRVVTVSNAGTTPLSWTPGSSGTDPDGHHLAGVLDVSWRDGTCGVALPPGPRALVPGASEQVCLRVEVPGGAPASVAASATRLTFDVGAAAGGWRDNAAVQSGLVSTIALTAPAATCVHGSITWQPVAGATAYQLVDKVSGAVVDTVTSGTLTHVLAGLLHPVTVRAVFGSSSWVSDLSASCG